MAALFRAMRQLPVERGDTRSAAASLDVGLEVLEDGQALGIYPEGTRSPDGRLYKFRTGVARLALRSGAPVVPVGLIGTREVKPPTGLALAPPPGRLCTSGRRSTSPAGRPTSAAPGRCARWPSRSGSPCRRCRGRTTSTPTPRRPSDAEPSPTGG